MKIVVEVQITLTQKINDCKQQTMMNILAIRMANHPFHLSSAYYHTSQPSDSPYQCTASKTWISMQIERESQQCSLIVLQLCHSTGCQRELFVLINLPCDNIIFKACVRYFYQIFIISSNDIALKKLSKKLFSFARYSNFCGLVFPFFCPYQPLLQRMIEDKS